MISDNLSLKGYHSMAGPEMPPSSYKTDAYITYVEQVDVGHHAVSA